MDDHWRIIEDVRRLTEGRMAERVIECVGKQWPLDLAGELVAEGGRLVIAGYHQDGPRQVNMQMWNWKGIDIASAHERDAGVRVAGLRAAVDALASGRLDPPDICLVYATPGQMIILINGLQWKNYRRFDWSVVGETACADSWGRALATGEPSLSLPCFAERRYGGVPDEEMLMAMPPRYLPIAIEGMKALSANGLRYPIPPYGIQNDVRAGMGVNYARPPAKS